MYGILTVIWLYHYITQYNAVSILKCIQIAHINALFSDQFYIWFSEFLNNKNLIMIGRKLTKYVNWKKD